MMAFDITFWEGLSYVVTVVGLPVAIVIFTLEQRKQRANEEDEIQQLLSDSYTDFLKMVIANPDLGLLTGRGPASRGPDQDERVQGLYEILVSIFERAYIMAYAPGSKGRRARYWRSWEDIMAEWCARPDFRAALPSLLVGEDEDFQVYLRAVAAKEADKDRAA